MAKFRFRSKVNVGRVITKIVAVVLGLWVGSEILSSVAVSMNTTTSVFATGLAFLGFGHSSGVMDGTVSSTGILSVVGLIAGASIILEFVKVSM